MSGSSGPADDVISQAYPLCRTIREGSRITKAPAEPRVYLRHGEIVAANLCANPVPDVGRFVSDPAIVRQPVLAGLRIPLVFACERGEQRVPPRFFPVQKMITNSASASKSGILLHSIRRARDALGWRKRKDCTEDHETDPSLLQATICRTFMKTSEARSQRAGVPGGSKK